MIYSVGENMYAFNSGIEFAQVQRTKAFNAANMPAKIITRQYNRYLARNAAWMGLQPDEYLNMYDYFQKVTDFEPFAQNVRTLAAIPRGTYHVRYTDNNEAHITENGQVLATVHLLPDKADCVGDIEYFNNLGDTMMTAYYDWRGFRSMVETYHPDGLVASQTYYDPAGAQVLAVTWMPENGESQATSWQLLNYHGQNYTFDSENQLFTFFLNELNDALASTFIVDRPHLATSVLGIDTPKRTIAYIHDSHLQQAATGNAYFVKGSYQPVLQPRGREFNLVAVATAQQAAQIKAQFPACVVRQVPTIYTQVVDDNTVTELQKILYVGRLAPDKNILGLLKVAAALKTHYPTIQLVLKGYFASSEYEAQILAEIQALQLDDNVTLVPYSVDDNGIYADASVFLSTSLAEGLGINMLTSLAHGVPVACYGIAYTEDNLIIDGANGICSDECNPQALAQKIITTFENPLTVMNLKVQAKQTAQQYQAEQLVTAWQQVLH